MDTYHLIIVSLQRWLVLVGPAIACFACFTICRRTKRRAFYYLAMGLALIALAFAFEEFFLGIISSPYRSIAIFAVLSSFLGIKPWLLILGHSFVTLGSLQLIADCRETPPEATKIE